MTARSVISIVSAAALLAACAGVASATGAAALDDTEIPVRGVVKAIDQAAISTDLAAQVSKIGFRAGEFFKAGDLLIAFDCDRYRAEAQAAEAVWSEMKLTVDSNEQLEKFRAVGRHDVEISKTRVAKAEAEAMSLKSRVAKCEFVAPFDGRVADLSVNVYEQPQPGKPFLVIVGHGRLEIELIVPSHWLGWMKPDAKFVFRADETDRDYDARIVRIGAAVDAVSQMVKVIAVFETPAGDILPGMSGVAHFEKSNG